MSLFRWVRRRIARMRARIQWIRTPERLKIQASVHEAGHTLAAWVLPTFGEIMKVTVLPEGDFRGYTLALHALSSPPEEEEIIHLMTMGMAGAAAECLLLGRSDAGSADDMIRTLGWWLLRRHGMTHATALAIAAAIVMEMISGDPARRTRATLVAMPPLSFAASRAIALLQPRLAELKKLAAALRRHRTLDHARVEDVLGPRPP
jgi:ATP-dependent Zn protease